MISAAPRLEDALFLIAMDSGMRLQVAGSVMGDVQLWVGLVKRLGIRCAACSTNHVWVPVAELGTA